MFTKDAEPRPGTTMEVLAGLSRPSAKEDGDRGQLVPAQ